jgi:hypothetical protein
MSRKRIHPRAEPYTDEQKLLVARRKLDVYRFALRAISDLPCQCRGEFHLPACSVPTARHALGIVDEVSRRESASGIHAIDGVGRTFPVPKRETWDKS